MGKAAGMGRAETAAKPIIGGVAVEDDCILLTIAEAGQDRVEAFREPSKVIWPKVRFRDRSFITDTVRDFFASLDMEILCVGISMFGLIDVETSCCLTVPRKGWRSYGTPAIDFSSILSETRHSSTKIIVHNDCTTRALAEYGALAPAEQNFCEEFVYLYIGFGINGGTLYKGVPRSGRVTPEMGHIKAVLHDRDPLRIGECVIHGECIDGLASARPILERANAGRKPKEKFRSLDSVPAHDLAWELEAYYIAQLCATVTLLLVPSRIVIGGPVMRAPLYNQVRIELRGMIADFHNYDATKDLDSYISPARLTSNAALLGALELARLRGRRELERGVCLQVFRGSNFPAVKNSDLHSTAEILPFSQSGEERNGL